MNAAMSVWDGKSLSSLLELEAGGGEIWRSPVIQLNNNGRAYGGQTIGQVMAAATRTARPDRMPTMLQLQFLSGARPGPQVEYHVSELQSGQTFTARHVRATQDGRPIADAHVSFAQVDRESGAPKHQAVEAPIEADPGRCMALSEMPRAWSHRLGHVSGYTLDANPCIDFRVPDAERQLFNPDGAYRFEFWMRVTSPVAPDPLARATAFAYASDWWMNYSSAAGHLGALDTPDPIRIYGASLNHAIWWHDELDPTQWTYCISECVATNIGRGLTIARFHDSAMQLRATTTQECLMRPIGAATPA